MRSVLTLALHKSPAPGYLHCLWTLKPSGLWLRLWVCVLFLAHGKVYLVSVKRQLLNFPLLYSIYHCVGLQSMNSRYRFSCLMCDQVRSYHCHSQTCRGSCLPRSYRGLQGGTWHKLLITSLTSALALCVRVTVDPLPSWALFPHSFPSLAIRLCSNFGEHFLPLDFLPLCAFSSLLLHRLLLTCPFRTGSPGFYPLLSALLHLPPSRAFPHSHILHHLEVHDSLPCLQPRHLSWALDPHSHLPSRWYTNTS